MKGVRRWFIGILVTALGLLIAIVACTAWLLYASLPNSDAILTLQSLEQPATVEFDELGIPRIYAQTRNDVYQVLGFVTARNRLFQMDLLRRSSAGRLAEILGPALLPADRWNRTMGYERLAREILVTLPEDQQAVLRAYSQGVNHVITNMRIPPFEFLLLGYLPEPWREEDSLLIMLGMHAMLTRLGDQERTVTIMEKILPPSVTAFFTPSTDLFTDRLSGKPLDRYPETLIPVRALQSLLSDADPAHQINVVSVPFLGSGSNGWVVAPEKTHDGRGILANDMHLKLGVPNIWYRAELHYGNHFFVGLTLPGVPLPIVGSNHHLAWGFTNIQGDFSDLVMLEVSEETADAYWTPTGLQRFGKRWETIQVKGADDESLLIRTTRWGPVLPQKLLGQEVAIRWTVLDPIATDLGLLNLDQASTVLDAIAIFNRAGGAPLNVLVADRQGNIGWSLMGKLPLRRGLSGLTSRVWAEDGMSWEGYLAPEQLPRLINPSSGYIVSANQRMVGEDFPYIIGHDYVNGYRAYRIAEQLEGMQDIREENMLLLQLDTRAGFYEFYRKLALETLDHSLLDSPDRLIATLRQQLANWDGQAESDSIGLAVLVEFRRALAESVLSPFLKRCWEIDDSFVYAWKNMDVPLLRLLSSKIPELLPYPKLYRNWDEFIGAVLQRSAQDVRERNGVNAFEGVRWGQINQVHISHPFSQAVPFLRDFLDMPETALAGCDLCVRVATKIGGASERLVVSPGRESDGILHMPGGQSGHPLSPHYRDQQQAWVDGIPTPLLAGETQQRLRLELNLKFRHD